MKRMLQSFAIALLAMTILGSVPASAAASRIVSVDRSFFEMLLWDQGAFQGTVGYVEYDPHSFDRYYEWLARQDLCWDQTDEPCTDLPEHYKVELSVIRADVRVRGRRFLTDDVAGWTYTDRCYPYCDAAIEYAFRDQSGDFVDFYCYGYRGRWPEPSCGGGTGLSYMIHGESGDQNDLYLTWRATMTVPWPVPVPGTLALLGLGLAGLGLSRRRLAV